VLTCAPGLEDLTLGVRGALQIRYRSVVSVVTAHPRAERRAFCAAVSSASEEPLAATASRIDHWLLIEYRGAWARDVLGECLFTPELKAHLRGQLAALPRSRLLFVKKPERRSQAGRTVFFGTSKPGQERFFALEVEHQNDLVGFDFADAIESGGGGASEFDGPLYVVCTHGKRDRCCARQGRPLYDGLRHETDTGHVWQSTHIGDRFAGNVVVLPQGLYYGRVEPDDVGRLLAAHAAGEIDLERYRGRSAYSFPAQAAEQTIRELEGLGGIDDLAFVDTRSLGTDAWSVRFRTPDEAVHEVDVAAIVADEPVYLTCDAAEPKRPRRFVATAHRVVS
jgi:hypothetical protein